MVEKKRRDPLVQEVARHGDGRSHESGHRDGCRSFADGLESEVGKFLHTAGPKEAQVRRQREGERQEVESTLILPKHCTLIQRFCIDITAIPKRWQLMHSTHSGGCWFW